MGRALLLVLMLTAVASAKPRVALVAFEGDSNGQVQEVVADLLDGDYTVTGSKQVSRTIDKLGLDTDLTAKDLKKLANELEADAIVRGDLSQNGKRKLLHVKLFVNGKKIRGFKVEFASLKSEKFKQALKDKMLEKLGGEDEKKAKEEDAEVGDKKKKKKKGEEEEVAAKAGGEEEETGDKKKKKKGEEESAGGEEGSESGEESEKKAKKRTAAAGEEGDEPEGSVAAGVTPDSGHERGANVAAVRVDVGPSLMGRTLTYNSRSFEQAPKNYSNAPVPGMRVAGELYPLAFGDPYGVASGLGLGAEYDQTFKLNLTSSVQMGTAFPVKQTHWSVGLRFRIVFGHKPTRPTLTLMGGYFNQQFIVDRSGLMEGNTIDLPDVRYKGFDPGLALRIPIVKALAFVASGQALLVTDAGPIQQPDSYGQARVTAAKAMVGVDILFGGHFGVRLAGEFAQYGFAFTGNGELAKDRDRDPTTPDVGGAADRYIGGTLTLAAYY